MQEPAGVAGALRSEALERGLWPLLVGAPADGSAPAAAPPNSVVWVDRGDEVVVHGDSLKVRFGKSTIVVAIDLESDGTGRHTLVVPMAVGTSPDHALGVVAEELPRGDATLARRWGTILTSALFAALEAIVAAHATANGVTPKSLWIEGAELRMRTAAPP